MRLPRVTLSTVTLSRRRALGAALSLFAGGVASRFGAAQLARAQAMSRQSQRRFVFCYFPGGWDQLLFLDPRDNAGRFTDANRSTTLIEPRYGDLDGYAGFTKDLYQRSGSALTFGPATTRSDVKGALDRVFEANVPVSIVRGIHMGTLSHEGGYRYFLTGKAPVGDSARGSSVATELAAQMNDGLAQTVTPIPTIALRVESYNEGHSGLYSALLADNIEDLSLVLERDAQLTEAPTVEDAMRAFRAANAPCEVSVYDRRGMLSRLRGSGVTATDLLRRNLGLHFRFLSEPAAMAPAGVDAMAYGAVRERIISLRSTFGFRAGDTINPGSSAARAMFAVQAITAGVGQCVSVNIGDSTDTHFGSNREHANLLAPGIKAVFDLLTALRSVPAPSDVGPGTWLDHTTVVAFSEFSRTPLFNPYGGRDHHMSNTCLLAGAGVAPGKVVGASTDVGMGSAPYDVAAGRVNYETGEPLKPEHIAATLLASAGLDATITRVEPLREALR